MTLRFPVGDLRDEPGFGAGSVQETAPFGPVPGPGQGGFSPHLVLAFQGVTARLVAPFDGFLRLVAAPGDAPGAPSVVEVQPLVSAATVALADGLDGLPGTLPETRAGLLPRVRLHGAGVTLVEAALAPLVTARVTATDPTQQAARGEEFAKGTFAVFVAAGTVIASGVTAVAVEVASSDGVPVDPVAYYSHYLALPPAPGTLLADRDWCQELFGRLTRRSLVQVVDEQGLAWATPVRVVDGTGTAADVDVSTTGGMLVAARFPDGGPPDVAISSVQVPEPGPEPGAQTADRYLLTSEWPAGGPEPVGPVALAPPTRPIMRRFVVTDLRRWLASQQVAVEAVRLPRYTLANSVTALVDGTVTFRFILADLAEAKAPGGFYYLTAWGIDTDVPLDGSSPGTALSALLEEVAAVDGGHVRVLVWDTFHVESAVLQETVAAAYGLVVLLLVGGAALVPPAAGVIMFLMLAGHAVWATDSVNPVLEAAVGKLLGDNAGAVAALEAVGAEVIFDGKVRQTRSDAAPRLYDFVGSHHQKLSVISGPAGMVAYCGGIDMRTNRLEDARHLDASPYHDVHCRVVGPAAADLATTFRQRWDDQAPAEGLTLAAGDGDLVAPPPAGSTQVVQVARTYPNGLDLDGSAYPFAPDGDLTIEATIHRAVSQARRYIYVEDQYLTPPDDLVALLAQRLTDVAALKLVMVIPRGSDQPENTSRRAVFIGNLLRDFGPERVIVLYPARPVFPHDRQRHGPVTSRLREPVTAAALELPVDDAAAFSESGTVLIGTEEVAYTTRKLPENKLVVGGAGRRGHNNTRADHHAHRSRVDQITYRDIFVHAKVWIVDDVFATIGSANVNNRGMNHDSECNVFVVDGRTDRGGRRFAKQLRVDLWAEHLGLGESTAARLLLDDPELALALLVARPGPAGNRLRRYWQTWNAEHRTESWESLLSPGLYWDTFQTIEGPLLDDQLWATYVDPDGTQPLT